MKTSKYKAVDLIRDCLTICTVFFFLFSSNANAQTKTSQIVGLLPVKSGYAPVNGLKMYYEIYGEGDPLVLLHGAFSNIHTDFDKILPVLAQGRQVIAVEQQGHGHTADINRSLRIDQMSDDTAELLKYLKIEKADFMGYSLGGAVAFNIAHRHPNLVRKFIWVGGSCYSPEGFYPEIGGMKNMTPETLVQALNGTPWQQAFAKIAPHPESWPNVVAKKIDMDLAFTGWKAEEVNSVKAPSLIIIGDADITRPEHVAELFRLLGGGVVGDIYGLPNARLAVLPGTTHVTVMNRSEWLTSMVTEFLQAPISFAGGKK
jgi:pimeloyl-ACP methyl ester carboxylesterase